MLVRSEPSEINFPSAKARGKSKGRDTSGHASAKKDHESRWGVGSTGIFSDTKLQAREGIGEADKGRER